jgi:hypothetical protein
MTLYEVVRRGEDSQVVLAAHVAFKTKDAYMRVPVNETLYAANNVRVFEPLQSALKQTLPLILRIISGRIV